MSFESEIEGAKVEPENIKSTIEFQVKCIQKAVWICCPSCEHWLKAGQLCALYKVRPPADVEVVGCEKWADVIPF